MKRHIMLAAMIALILALALPAMAGILTGGTMSVDLPHQWTGVYRPADNQFQISSPDETAHIAVQVVGNQHGANLAQKIARILAIAMNGTEPEKIDDNHYYFTANMDGMDLRASIRGAGSKALAYLEIGDTAKFAEDIKKILNSFKSRNPEEQAALNLLKK